MNSIPSRYGTRAQTAALVRTIEDARGNKDGIAGNEHLPAGSTRGLGASAKQPLLHRFHSTFETGLSTRDEERRISTFVSGQEAAWGRKVTDLPPSAMPDFERFRAEKAAALTRFDRHPGDVTEGFVTASGTVDGQRIASREVFWQRWKPIGPPSGKVVVLSPGFQETGRNFHEQIQLLNRQGHDVVVMDHQWAGYTRGNPGGLDRGYGVARDVAAVSAFASEMLKKEYAGRPGAEVILMGNSMGAGPGVLGALTLNDAGKIRLDGPQMPKGLSAILQAPFIQMTPSVLNQGVATAGKVPVLNQVALPSTGLPVLTHDEAASAKFALHATRENVVAQTSAMNAATADLGRVRDLIARGQGPTGRVYIIHGDKDPLADPSGSREVARALGGRAQLQVIQSNNHILEESAREQRHILEGMRWLTGR
jgi:alpha-beta hydrolase superfamily lysophospholipase